MKFVQTQLGYEATTDTGLQYLRDVHEKFLPESIGGPSPKRVRRAVGAKAVTSGAS